MKLLEGKKALILGIANERSLAYGIAKEFQKAGARLAITFLNQAMEKRVTPLANELGADFTCEMDVSVDEHYDLLKNKIEEKWGNFDILVHSLAFAPTEDLKGDFLSTSRQGFTVACDVSAYSLVALSRTLVPLMNPEGSIMAMTYHGSTQVVRNYNVMGVAKAALEASMRYLAYELGTKTIRVNCISAGPMRTLASSGVADFRDMLKNVEEKAPLHRNITLEDVGQMALFLAANFSKNVTGQVLYVDSGHSVVAI